MKVDASLTKAIEHTKAAAADLEAAGYDGMWVGRDEARSVPAAPPGRRGDRAGHDRLGRRHRLRPLAR